jgi:hypothetical protein
LNVLSPCLGPNRFAECEACGNGFASERYSLGRLISPRRSPLTNLNLSPLFLPPPLLLETALDRE